MDKFWVVTLFHFQPLQEQRARIEQDAFELFGALGIEEYSLDEAQVDELLGDRSYSGGDLPLEVLEEVESKVLSKPSNHRFFFSTSKESHDFLTYVSSGILCEIQIEEKVAEDWNAEWKKHYAPILVNNTLEIIPAWQMDYKSSARKQIFINPGMGFGTGSHETTFLCLRLFTENLLGSPLQTVLDFGSGSGILGLSTLKFFPDSRVDFFDIDPEANKNCFQNAELNGLADLSFRLLLPEHRNKLLSEYDVVFANILESILHEQRDALIGHTCVGGALILSGLLNHQVDGIIKSYTDKGLKLTSHLTKGDWAALLFKKGNL